MHETVRKTSVVAAAALACAMAIGLARSASAQIDPGNFLVLQGGRIVGEVYVPPRASGATRYVEHWVLLPDYRSPARGQGAEVMLQPASWSDPNKRRFFERVSFPAGSRYVCVNATESNALPQ